MYGTLLLLHLHISCNTLSCTYVVHYYLLLFTVVYRKLSLIVFLIILHLQSTHIQEYSIILTSDIVVHRRRVQYMWSLMHTPHNWRRV